MNCELIKCPSCEASIPADSAFCPNCGRPLSPSDRKASPLPERPGQGRALQDVQPAVVQPSTHPSGEDGGGQQRPKPAGGTWWVDVPQGVTTAAKVALAAAGVAIVAFVVYWLVPDKLVDVEHFASVTEPADSLTAVYPHASRVELELAVLPSIDNDSIVACATAALTGEKLPQFAHSNIAGDHVSHGEHNAGYKSSYCTGVFTWVDGSWNFGTDRAARDLLADAAARGGAGFMQDLLIHDGIEVKHRRASSDRVECRALCEREGRLCVIQSDKAMRLGDFVTALLDYGVDNAISLTMSNAGSSDPWNYAWYRNNEGLVTYLQEHVNDGSTNWLVFYK